MYITDIVYLLDVLVVIVYMSYCICWDYLLLYEDWGECSEDWGGGGGRAGGGGGGGAKKCSWGLKTQTKTKKMGEGRTFFFPTNFVFKNVPGVLKRMQKKIFFGGGGNLGCLGRPTPSPGGRAGSENDTLLPMTMTCDRLQFWSGAAWRSKVIIRKPWRRKN